MIVITVIATIVHFLLVVYFGIMFARLILDLLRSVSRDWRPRGFLLVATELVYSLTDPPLRAARRVIKPVRVGGMALDLAFSAVMLVVIILMYVANVVSQL